MSGINRTVIIDATDLILGRLASFVAKRLLWGERIIIVNAEKAIISGKRQRIMKDFKEFLSIGHPGKGPLHPRKPEKILRRTIRGMLPWKKPKGRDSYRRLKVFIGVPKLIEEKEFQTIPEAHVRRLRCPYITLEKLAMDFS
jgi:large subunit ribosomal protein L13